MAHTQRLRKLADHLLHGKLGHDHFDFSLYNVMVGANKIHNCGFTGCAIGECPVVFPDEWIFADRTKDFEELNSFYDGDFPPRLKKTTGSTMKDVMIFFELSTKESYHLFTPDQQSTYLYGGQNLDSEATKEQVAENILKFCELTEKKIN